MNRIKLVVTKTREPVYHGYEEYLEKHGHHFTDALAERASDYLKNADGSEHRWTPAQVSKQLEILGLKLPEHVSNGDVTYLANMYYSDFYPDVLKDEASCIKMAHKAAIDVDGYKGMTFKRWLTDIESRKIDIDFEEFV